MRLISIYFSDYSVYHQHPLNKISHMIGIPMIMLTTFGLFSLISFGEHPLMNLGFIVWILSSIWYLKLDWKLSLPFCAINLGIYALGNMLALKSVPASWILFVLGWIAQGIGHYVYEKKSPAFFKNIQHLLVGPLWIYSFLTNQLGRY
jgi:uncharacterized membrane protein YGL010W